MRRLAACLALGTALACATTPPPSQDFVAVATPHFEVMSSLGEDETMALADDLERFHVGVAFALGLAPEPAPSGPMRVLAFDDRSLTRPFRKGGGRAYLLPTEEGAVLVLRAGGSWREDSDPQLRHDYAHHLFRSRRPGPWPLWYEEGLSQLASTVEVRGETIRVGQPRGDYVVALRDWRMTSLDPLLAVEDVSDWTLREREELDAESWALAHYLTFSQGTGGSREKPLAHFAKRVAIGEDPVLAAYAAFGAKGDKLAGAVDAYVKEKRMKWVTVAPRGTTDARARHSARSVSRSQSRIALAELALALGRAPLAIEILETVSDVDARVHSGLAVAARIEGRLDDADAAHARARALAPDDPVMLRETASTRIARARMASDVRTRASAIAAARDLLMRALDRAPDDPAIHARLAETFLVAGDHLTRGLQHVALAQQGRPASLALRLLEAQLLAASGETAQARQQARYVVGRGHASSIADQARALLAELPLE